MTTPDREIPIWMMVLNLIILVILSWKSWAVLASPEAVFGVAQHYELPHHRALWELLGRNLAMMAIGVWALLRPGRMLYGAVFLMGLVRETADMIFASGLMPGDSGSIHPEVISFLLFLVPYGIALRRLSRRPEGSTAPSAASLSDARLRG